MRRFLFPFVMLLMGNILGTFSANATEPDFDYPQTVSANALKQLKSAQKSGDGQLMVDALVQYSIAKSLVSEETMDTIITQIEQVKAREKRPDYKALLNYFEALVFISYADSHSFNSRANAADAPLPADYTEWDRKQFEAKTWSLCEEALASRDALLKCPVTGYPKIIKVEDDMGARYIPTLYQFLCTKCIEVLRNTDKTDVVEDLWVNSCKEGTPEWFYAMTTTHNAGDSFETYEAHKDNEHSALFLLETNKKEHYTDLLDYLKRFPDSYYAPTVKNEVTAVQAQNAYIYYPAHIHSGDSIEISVNATNINKLTIKAYRFNDDVLAMLEKYNELELAKLELVAEQEVNIPGFVPFSEYRKVNFQPLPYGKYVFTCEFANNLGKPVAPAKVRNYTIATVHDMIMFETGGTDFPTHVFVADTKTGAPLQGVDMNITSYNNSKDKSTSKALTDRDGSVAVPDKYSNHTVKAAKGGDRYGDEMRVTTFHEESRGVRLTASIFTDLDIYRPGETVQFVAVLNQITSEVMRPVTGERVKVTFTDANRKGIDTLELVSDDFGRVTGQFIIPTDRMNGSFNISIHKVVKNDYLASKSINVSEYKTPTFTVSFADSRTVYTKDQSVKIVGKAQTYSGVPVPNAQVKLRLYKREWSWWWYRESNRGVTVADTVLTTDASGEFTLELPASTFPENSSRHFYYSYIAQAQCTNEAGETQEASHRFIIGDKRGLELASPIEHNNVAPLKLPLQLNTTRDNETSVECYYKVENDNKEVVMSGNIASDKPVVDMTALPTGEYKLSVNILGEEPVVTATLYLYRMGKTETPVKDNPLWIPTKGRSVDDNNVAHITIGNSTPKAHVYYIASSRDKVERQGWTTLKQGMNDFTIAVPGTPGGYLTIQFYCVSNGKVFSQSVTAYSNVKRNELKIKVNAFRDKLLSGEHEKWSLQLVDENGRPVQGAMMLEMIDKAINDISPNTWSFSPSRLGKYVVSHGIQSISGSRNNSLSWQDKNVTENDCELPWFNLYDTELFANHPRIDYLIGGARNGMALYENAMAMPEPRMYKSAAMAPAMADGATLETTEEAEETADAPVDEELLDQVEVRESDVKVALWKPLLTTDRDGNLVVEFDAPNFNTTWLVQALAYNNDLLTDKLTRNVLTSKPIMVKSSVPRFLRQGDNASLAATLQNSTDGSLAADAVIELFNPRNGDIIERKTFNEQLAASGSNALKITWNVPDTIPFVGFRVKAATGTFGDGEQVLIPVLPSISPVIETQPFYLDAATSNFTTRLPQFAADARVTLEYCDNPVWYCVQALPTIFSDNYNVASSLAHSLFAQTLAKGIADKYPNIREAISYWKENESDSTLVSMLERNTDLKIGTLLASPWVREADKQTLRMSRLNELLDEKRMAAEHLRIVEGLKNLQMSDGGWTWYRYPGCRSSLYTTHEVLELIGELRHLGYLKDDATINAMVKSALRYYDSKELELYNEQIKRNKKNYSGFADYVYVRTLFTGDFPLPAANQKMFKNCLKAMTTDWKGDRLGDKAFYALALNRNGYSKVAKSIVESIRQFALTKPETGMYWDNAQSGWRYFDKVAVTSTILQAMNEVDPRTAEIDKVRKWILLMKQTNDWGSSSLAADAVYSLLATGSNWLGENETPTITIDGKPVEFSKIDSYLGYCRKEIPATSLAALTISRNGASPAWGAVYSQFRAEMKDIESQSVYDLSIVKEFYVYQTDGSLRRADTFRVGDKVQVRTIIKNAKDLDFVTVKDERGSCFEPKDKLSGYRYADATCYYLEVKDSETNMFFTSLDKGTHIISYDAFVTAPGRYSVGIATAQCQYAPQITAHSAGSIATVE